MRTVIHGATYINKENETVIFEGASSTRAVITRNGETTAIPIQEFFENYTITEKHNHEAFCCSIHETHTTPHKGCMLR